MQILSGVLIYVTIASLLYATNEVWSSINYKRWDASFKTPVTTGGSGGMELD